MPILKTAGEKDVVAQLSVEWSGVQIHYLDIGDTLVILLCVVQSDRCAQLLWPGHRFVAANGKDVRTRVIGSVSR